MTVPAPRSLQIDSASDRFVLTAATPILGDDIAAAEVHRLLAARTGLTLAAPDATAGTATGTDAGAIRLTVAPGGPAESYRLTSAAHGVVVTGADAAGLFYGVQTLVQLIAEVDGAWTIPAAHIDDAPRFAYRGAMLDVARHFHPVETVKAFIDRASSLKFNHLHLHLTDDQGWRIEITRRPLLTERGSGTSANGDPGGFYTQDDYREIIAYAAARHMTVVPEIDLPGHTHAVTLAYPEVTEPPVISEHIHEIVDRFGGGLPRTGAPYTGYAVGFSSLRIHDEATYAFLRDVLGELAELTPGPYLHIGGDEALGTDPEDFALFIERATHIAAETGKTPVAWHEAGAIGERLAPGTVGQYWGLRTPIDGMDEKTRAFVRAGGKVILSPADAIYLDMKHTDDDGRLGLTWAGIVPPRQSYEWDPAAIIDGIDESDILGVEAALWTETVRDLDDIDAQSFPRIAAAAEAAWSAPWTSTAARSWASFRERVTAVEPLWAALGIGGFPIDGFDDDTTLSPHTPETDADASRQD